MMSGTPAGEVRASTSTLPPSVAAFRFATIGSGSLVRDVHWLARQTGLVHLQTSLTVLARAVPASV
jgi:hypothetical protein